MATLPRYAELHCVSNFTFLRGASHPEELVARAARLGYSALAITDECSLAGVVRAHLAARAAAPLRLIVGTEIALADGPRLVLLATDRAGYGRLAHLITRGRRAAAKGAYHLARADLADGVPGCLALWLPPSPLHGVERSEETHAGAPSMEIGNRVQGTGNRKRGAVVGALCPVPRSLPLQEARWIADTFPGRAWIAVELCGGPDDRARLRSLEALGRRAGLPLVAAGDVHMHARGRRALQDTLTAVRLGVPVHAAGRALHPNGERHLRPRSRLARLYPARLLEETARVAERCTFSLDELRYEYPEELVPPGETPASYLRRLAAQGMQRRWPAGAPEKVRAQVEHELGLIRRLEYEPYFLTVSDLVRFARARGILCQGRGSAANSAVCYCLGVTEVDPARTQMLFERFVSAERDEPPDIDIDFEHERREEVIQYVYRKYGRERAALAATVITYRPRSAVRDVGKALGLSVDQVDRLAGSLAWWDGRRVIPERVRDAGFDPAHPTMRRLLALVDALIGFPRHLSQHVGGFVISRGPLSELVAVENAAMPERTVIQWDKNDLDALGLLKVDCLGLGMLSALRRALALVERYRGRRLTLASVPADDPAVYRMIQRADTVGVFQIESRAQMAMLPRLRPATFYDLVIEVAIVRPGPIQGRMVHPYLARRQGRESVTYPGEAVRAVLERTLGVPLFQEQVIKLAMVAAGFTPGEADALRRAMAAWRRRGGLEPFERRLVEGMSARGYSTEFARRIFEQIKGFGEYGFPESHAASFALLVYASAWLKHHEPAAFACALLNSQPMGFYPPSRLVADAREHGVEVRGVDATASAWETTLERRGDGEPALRLGLHRVKGLSREGAGRLVAARAVRPFSDVADLVHRAGLGRGDHEALAAAGALAPLAGDRHRARWQALGVEPALPLLETPRVSEATPALPVPTEGEDLAADYASLGLSLGRHPLALLRPRLERLGAASAGELAGFGHGQRVCAAGLVAIRQRPASARGATFLTLEDETGQTNVVVWKDLAERARRALVGARLLLVHGTLEREGEVRHVIADRLADHSGLLGDLTVVSRDFR